MTYYFPQALFLHCYSCDAAVPNEILNGISECAFCGEQKRIHAIVPLEDILP